MERRLISSGSTFEQQIGYSRAVVAGDWVFVSGTTGFDYATMAISDDIAEQTAQCLRNIGAALEQGGATFADVVRFTAFVTDRAYFPVYGAVRSRYVSGNAFASTLVIVSGFTRPEFKVEVEVTAVGAG